MRQFLTEMTHEQREIRRVVYNIVWHMRGMTRDEAWCLCPQERNDIDRLVKERMEIVQKTGLALI